MTDAAVTADDQKHADGSDPADAATTVAAAALARYAAEADKLRQRADLAAKVLAGGGSTLITAVGIAKFSDLFPLPPADRISWPEWVPWWVAWRYLPGFRTHVELAIVGVLAGFGLMIAAILLIARGYWEASEVVPMRSDLNRLDLKGDERTLVKDAFDDQASLNDVPNLAAYEARAHRLERVARWLPADQAKQTRMEATLIQTEVLATQYQGRLRVVRRRVANSVRGAGAMVLYSTFVVGLILFGLGTDYLSSERTDAIAIAKACADARTVDANLSLPAICGDAPPMKPSPDAAMLPRQLTEAKQRLARLLAACYEDAEADASLDAGQCEVITQAISALGSS
jgi:hypothetical protein